VPPAPVLREQRMATANQVFEVAGKQGFGACWGQRLMSYFIFVRYHTD